MNRPPPIGGEHVDSPGYRRARVRGAGKIKEGRHGESQRIMVHVFDNRHREHCPRRYARMRIPRRWRGWDRWGWIPRRWRWMPRRWRGWDGWGWIPRRWRWMPRRWRGWDRWGWNRRSSAREWRDQRHGRRAADHRGPVQVQPAGRLPGDVHPRRAHAVRSGHVRRL